MNGSLGREKDECWCCCGNGTKAEGGRRWVGGEAEEAVKEEGEKDAAVNEEGDAVVNEEGDAVVNEEGDEVVVVKGEVVVVKGREGEGSNSG